MREQHQIWYGIPVPPDEQDEQDETLSEAFWAVARLLRRRNREALAPWDVTPSQSRAVGVLTRHGTMRLSELAEHLRIVARSATEVVDDLQERGLVERLPDPRRPARHPGAAHRTRHRGRHRDPRLPRRRGRGLLQRTHRRRPRGPQPHPAHPAPVNPAERDIGQFDPERTAMASRSTQELPDGARRSVQGVLAVGTGTHPVGALEGGAEGERAAVSDGPGHRRRPWPRPRPAGRQPAPSASRSGTPSAAPRRPRGSAGPATPGTPRPPTASSATVHGWPGSSCISRITRPTTGSALALNHAGTATVRAANAARKARDEQQVEQPVEDTCWPGSSFTISAASSADDRAVPVAGPHARRAAAVHRAAAGSPRRRSGRCRPASRRNRSAALPHVRTPRSIVSTRLLPVERGAAPAGVDDDRGLGRRIVGDHVGIGRPGR